MCVWMSKIVCLDMQTVVNGCPNLCVCLSLCDWMFKIRVNECPSLCVWMSKLVCPDISKLASRDLQFV